MPEPLTNGFTIITLLIKLAHHIKPMVTIMESDALLILNVETVSPIKDVGLKKELKSTESNNSETSLDNKT